MKMNPQMLRALVKKGCSQCVATSRYVLRRIGPIALQDTNDLSTFDESILQQGRFWIRTVTWTLVGSSMFALAKANMLLPTSVQVTVRIQKRPCCRMDSSKVLRSFVSCNAMGPIRRST